MYFSEALNKICQREQNQPPEVVVDNLRVSHMKNPGPAFGDHPDTIRELIAAWSHEAKGMVREAEDIDALKSYAIVLGYSLAAFFSVMVTYILILAF